MKFIFIIFITFVLSFFSNQVSALDVNDCSNINIITDLENAKGGKVIDGYVDVTGYDGICIDDEFKNINTIISKIFIIIFLIYLFSTFVRIQLKINHLLFNSIFLYSIIFSLFFIIWSLSNVNDSISYYSYAVNHDYPFKLGAMFITNFSEIFIDNFKMGYLELNFIYFLFNILGLIIFSKIIYDPILQEKKPIDYLFYFFFLFSPSLNFWISGMNKESLTFLGLVGIIWSFSNKKIFFIILFSLIILLVRPYILFLIIFSYLIFLFIRSNKSFFTYLFILISTVLIAFLMHYFQTFLRIPFDILSYESVISFFSSRQISSYEGSNLNYKISLLNFPFLLFSYLFRPSIIEAKNLFYLVISIDNLILLFFVIYRFIFSNKLAVNYKDNLVLISLIIFVVSLLIFCLTTNNLGIALRQKWMLIPFLIIALSNRKKYKQ